MISIETCWADSTAAVEKDGNEDSGGGLKRWKKWFCGQGAFFFANLLLASL